MPNSLRSFVVPDQDYVLLNADLVKADFHVVCWEAGETQLKALLRSSEDVYTTMTRGLVSYALAKRFAHAANYCGTAKTLAQNCGMSIREAEAAQQGYFSRYPGIPAWHKRVREQLRARPPSVTNAFGYRRTYLDIRDETALESAVKEACAWIGQSTVACVTNRAMLAVDTKLPWCQVLLHGHDSLLVQLPHSYYDRRSEILQCMQVPVPYADPLVIPVGCEVSEANWASVKKVPWQ